MKKLGFIICTIFYSMNVISQDVGFDWAKTIGRSESDRATKIVTDNDGNLYSTGFYSNTMDFDPGVGVHEMTSLAGTRDIYVNKLDENGEFIWCFSIGGIGSDASNQIHFDDSGNIYISGIFSETVDFDPGIETYELTSMGFFDCFILKIDTAGNFIWAKSVGGGSYDSASEIETDESGNIYIAGVYTGTIDIDPGIGFFAITSNGEQDIFIQKLNSDGEFIWAKSIGVTMDDRVGSINVDALENVHFSGTFEGTIDLDPNLGVSLMTSNGSYDSYILKLDSDGSFIRSVQIGGPGPDFILSSILDEYGNIHATGYFDDSVDFDPSDAVFKLHSHGVIDFFILKMDSEGNLIWVKRGGGVGTDKGNSIALDVEDNVYTSGSFGLTMDFDPGPGFFTRSSMGDRDMYVQKLNSSGDFVWATTLGAEDYDTGASLNIDLEGNLYILGEFEHTVDFNPYLGESNHTSNGLTDIFILKFKNCSPIATTDFITSCISYTWINDTTYYENNNSASVILSNVIGCDSVVTLDLTINEVDITTTAIGGVLTSNATGATYQWLDCNDGYSEIAGAINQIYTPIDDGDYSVKVTIGSCTDTSACIAVDGVGLNDNEELSQIHLYPNPNNGLFNINLGQVQATLIQISSANGTIIYSNSTNLSGIHQIALNISAGLYFVDVLTEGGTYQMKLVVE